jgi:glutamate dehydrogenase
VLRAPVELLWNGGIGTYVKDADETHADAGDPANDPVRVDADELRCKVVGEGGNLGFTQRARITFALAAAASTPTRSTTRPAWTCRTTRSTSRSCSTRWSPMAT